jgi:hypothetical protein
MRFLHFIILALAVSSFCLIAEEYDPVSARRDFPVIIAGKDIKWEDYIETFYSDMPLVLLIDHGGIFMLTGEPSGPYPNDILLDEMFSLLMKEFYKQAGTMPSYVYNWVRRDYVNPNRPSNHAESFTRQDTMGRAVYNGFHQRADELIEYTEKTFGDDMGFIINLHTSRQLAPSDSFPYLRTAELGIVVPWEKADLPDNSMLSLYKRKGQKALTLGDGLPYLIHTAGEPCKGKKECRAFLMDDYRKTKKGGIYPVLPAFSDKKKDKNTLINPMFTGWFTISSHGSGTRKDPRWQNGMDAVQLELDVSSKSILAERDGKNAKARLNQKNAQFFCQNLVRSVLAFLRINYNYIPPEERSIFIIDDGDEGFFSSSSDTNLKLGVLSGIQSKVFLRRVTIRLFISGLPEDDYALYIRMPYYRDMPIRLKVTLESLFTKTEFFIATQQCPCWIHAGNFRLSNNAIIVIEMDEKKKTGQIYTDAVMLKRLFYE